MKIKNGFEIKEWKMRNKDLIMKKVETKNSVWLKVRNEDGILPVLKNIFKLREEISLSVLT